MSKLNWHILKKKENNPKKFERILGISVRCQITNDNSMNKTKLKNAMRRSIKAVLSTN